MSRFLIYRSSAGSGKTYTLTKEYLRLVLTCPDSVSGGKEGFRPDYFRHILAVTFTNDAAGEMKARVLQELSLMAKGEGRMIQNLIEEWCQEWLEAAQRGEIDPFYRVVRAAMGEDDTLEGALERLLIARAARIHDRMLHQYADLSITTIDAFNNRIIRSFAKELKLPYHYDIELDADELLNSATDELQAHAGQQEAAHVTRFLVNFAKSKLDDSKDWSLDRDLQKFGKRLFSEEEYQAISCLADKGQEDFKSWEDALKTFWQQADQQLRQIGDRCSKALQEHGLTAKHFYNVEKHFPGLIAKAQQGIRAWSGMTFNTYTTKAVMGEGPWTNKTAGAAAEAAMEQVKPLLTQAWHTLKALRHQIAIAAHLRKELYPLALAHEIERELALIKNERSLVHISDFNREINKVVEGEPIPFIYERIGERYYHVLIDEFQDTSRLQWHNLIPLVAGALARGNMCMVVGDAKQAIYRWRGGRASLLVDLPAVPTADGTLVATHTSLFPKLANPRVLAFNYRSRTDIVHFNNALYAHIAALKSSDYPDVSRYYAEVHQHPKGKAGGHVEIFTGADPKDTDAFYTARTLQIIREVLAAGYMPGDIAILVRERKNARLIAQALVADGMQVLSSESLQLNQSPLVCFLTDFLQLMHQTRNPVLKMSLLNTMSVFRTGQNLSGDEQVALKEVCAQNELMAYFGKWKEKFGVELEESTLRSLSVYELLEELIRCLGLHGDEWAGEQAYVEKLLEQALIQSQKRGHALPDFLDFWAKKRDELSISTPENVAAVRIMTIHKSKGLQFPVVILPAVDWPTNKTEGIWVDVRQNADIQSLVPGWPVLHIPVRQKMEDQVPGFEQACLAEKQATFLEALNLLYVATTRPEDRLYLLVPPRSDKENNLIASLVHSYIAYTGVQPIKDGQDQRYTLYLDEQPYVPAVPKHTAIAEEPFGEWLHTRSQKSIRVSRNVAGRAGGLRIADLYAARTEGNLLHYAFERVRYTDDIPAAARRLVTEGLLSEHQLEKVIATMQAVADLPAISRYFHPPVKVRNEQDILTLSDQGEALTYRPDRLVQDGQQWVILDYKTGQEDPGHHAQLKGYAFLLQKAGYNDVRKFLVYTETLRVVEVGE